MSWNSSDDVSRGDHPCLLENCWIARTDPWRAFSPDDRRLARPARGGCDSPVWGTDSTGPDDDETFTKCLKRALRSHGAPELPEGGESMSFKDLVLYLRARYGSEEGQTMAEYGVVLAVIAIGVVVALTALSGGISGAINGVVGYL